MSGRRVIVVVLLARLCSAAFDGALLQNTLAKVYGPWSSYTSVRTMQLLNQLCNELRGNDSTTRDACYGCFFRASSQPSGYPMLLAMATCADSYLNNTYHGHCQQYLRNATNVITSKSNPSTIYCTFLECIRRANKDILIRECVGEAMNTFDSFNCTEAQLAQLFVNTTACVLAKTRCATLNPITGEQQDEDNARKHQAPLVNAVQVNSDYDLSILQLPFVLGKNDECVKYRNVEQASWPSANC